jgi:glycine cleavage system H protein
MSEFLETTIDKFIFKVATDRLYSPEGVWIKDEGRRVRLGVADYQQQLIGDVAFVHLKPVGTVISAGDEFVEIESIKATVSADSPVAGKIVEVNREFELNPERVNQDPYGQGWLALVEPTNWPADRAKLLDAESYLAVMRSHAEKELEK